ncbi:MAG: hypothetical protein GF384_02060, partial [Elusimicrobia bacterium]|nr:hypothetical protein [Elusimicrobiota bacterium]MBD3411770.1 hypothetical protein [Elusimicrobiota bacterium]
MMMLLILNEMHIYRIVRSCSLPLVVAALIITVLGPMGVSAKVVDRAVAVVNGEPILLSELEKNIESLNDIQQRLQPNRSLTESEKQQQKKDVLDQMIDDKLMLQEAKRKKIKVVKRDLEKGIAQVKSRFRETPVDPENEEDLLKPLSKAEEKKFEEELKKEGITEQEFEERIRDQVRVINLIDQEVKAEVERPAEEEIKALFNKLKKILAGEKITGLEE